MKDLVSWIVENKEWVFSGVGVAVLSLLIALITRRRRSAGQASQSIQSQTQQTGTGTIAYQAGGNISIVTSQTAARREANLSVVSVDVIDNIENIKRFREEWLDESADNGGMFPIIDIKVRNTGDEPAFISHLDIQIKRKKVVPDLAGYYALPASWEYTVLLNPHVETDTKTIMISQKVPPNDLDRFFLIIGHDMDYGELIYADYELKMRLRYNKKYSVDLGLHSIRIHAPVLLAKDRQVGARKLPLKK